MFAFMFVLFVCLLFHTACACFKGGSVRDDCEQMFGQCICKDNVMGSKCDVCPIGMTMTSTGCEGRVMQGAWRGGEGVLL